MPYRLGLSGDDGSFSNVFRSAEGMYIYDGRIWPRGGHSPWPIARLLGSSLLCRRWKFRANASDASLARCILYIRCSCKSWPAGRRDSTQGKSLAKTKRDSDNHRIRTCAGEPSRFRVCLLNHSDRLPRSYNLMPQGIYQHSRSSSAAHSQGICACEQYLDSNILVATVYR
jgi:hypothetical protein